MSRRRIDIDPEIRRASTMPSWVYTDPGAYELQKERVFARAWHLVGDAARLRSPGHVLPFTLLPGCLDEPLVWTSDDSLELRCLSNVCTHRGTLVVEGEGHVAQLRCRYHGRRFDLSGRMTHVPGFDGAEDFPSPSDDLPQLATVRWGPFHFTSLSAATPFDAWIGPMRDRMSFLPVDEYEPDPASTRDYLIDANWALYVENYDEGFHVPYVHGRSLGVLDHDAYSTELHGWCNLQLGIGRAGDAGFRLPPEHPDSGRNVIAYYWWLFPNLMFNFYPDALSINVVQPLGAGRTRVSFIGYRRSGSDTAPSGANADLHRVEMEDEAVVEAVQRGMRSRLYSRGRYSPERETGTHHFHRLLAQAMNGD